MPRGDERAIQHQRVVPFAHVDSSSRHSHLLECKTVVSPTQLGIQAVHPPLTPRDGIPAREIREREIGLLAHADLPQIDAMHVRGLASHGQGSHPAPAEGDTLELAQPHMDGHRGDVAVLQIDRQGVVAPPHERLDVLNPLGGDLQNHLPVADHAGQGGAASRSDTDPLVGIGPADGEGLAIEPRRGGQQGPGLEGLDGDRGLRTATQTVPEKHRKTPIGEMKTEASRPAP